VSGSACSDWVVCFLSVDVLARGCNQLASRASCLTYAAGPTKGCSCIVYETRPVVETISCIYSNSRRLDHTVQASSPSDCARCASASLPQRLRCTVFHSTFQCLAGTRESAGLDNKCYVKHSRPRKAVQASCPKPFQFHAASLIINSNPEAGRMCLISSIFVFLRLKV